MNKNIISLCIICLLVVTLIGCRSIDSSVTTNNEKKISVSMAKFDSVDFGMSLEELEGIMGGKGTLAYIGKYSTYYKYVGDNGLLANAVFRFDGAELDGKSQMGIK